MAASCRHYDALWVQTWRQDATATPNGLACFRAIVQLKFHYAIWHANA